MTEKPKKIDEVQTRRGTTDSTKKQPKLKKEEK